MKREQIIKKIETLAGLFYGKRVEVHTCRDIYPKCYLVVLGIHGEAVQHLTDPMLPTKLLAHVRSEAMQTYKFYEPVPYYNWDGHDKRRIYCINDKETGNVIVDYGLTLDEARNRLAEIENEDKAEGLYKEDFWEISRFEY